MRVRDAVWDEDAGVSGRLATCYSKMRRARQEQGVESKSVFTLCNLVSCSLQEFYYVVGICDGGCEAVCSAVGESVELAQQTRDVRVRL